MTSWELSTPLPHSKGNLWLVSLYFPRTFHQPKLFPNNSHTKESSETEYQKAGLPCPPPCPPSSWSCQGTSVTIAHTQASATHFTACFLFSLFYFLCTNGKMRRAKQLTSGALGCTQGCRPAPSLSPAPSFERHLNPSRLPVYLLPLLEAKILGISSVIRFQGGKERGGL